MKRNIITTPTGNDTFYELYLNGRFPMETPMPLKIVHYDIDDDKMNIYTSGCREDPCEVCVYKDRRKFNNDLLFEEIEDEIFLKLKLLELKVVYFYLGRARIGQNYDTVCKPGRCDAVKIKMPDVWDDKISQMSSLISLFSSNSITTRICSEEPCHYFENTIACKYNWYFKNIYGDIINGI